MYSVTSQHCMQCNLSNHLELVTIWAFDLLFEDWNIQYVDSVNLETNTIKILLSWRSAELWFNFWTLSAVTVLVAFYENRLKDHYAITPHVLHGLGALVSLSMHISTRVNLFLFNNGLISMWARSCLAHDDVMKFWASDRNTISLNVRTVRATFLGPSAKFSFSLSCSVMWWASFVNVVRLNDLNLPGEVHSAASGFSSIYSKSPLPGCARTGESTPNTDRDPNSPSVQVL